MAAVTIRNLSEDTHRALKRRALSKGKSTEAEIRAILEEAVMPKDRLKLGSELAALGRDLQINDFELHKDRTPAGIITFE